MTIQLKVNATTRYGDGITWQDDVAKDVSLKIIFDHSEGDWHRELIEGQYFIFVYEDIKELSIEWTE